MLARGVLTLLLAGALSGCVGDSPTGGDAATDGATDVGTSDASGDTSPGDAGDAGCAQPTTQCGSTCVNLDSNMDNCGACGHACTSRSCVGGKCSYQTVFIAGGTAAGTLGGNVGGLAGADQLCQQAASTAALAGKFVAWLSAGGNSPSTRFTVKSTNPYKLVDATPVATSWLDLTDGTIGHAIDKDAKGVVLTGTTHLVMTNTKGDGTSLLGSDCSGWQSATGTHSGGATNTNAVGWTENGYPTGDCATMTYNLYCFEQ